MLLLRSSATLMAYVSFFFHNEPLFELSRRLILFEISGFSIKEVAGLQAASISAVKQRLKRGREKLTEILTFESEYKTGEVNYE